MPSTSECIHKLWYVCTMEYYLAIKWNKLLIHIRAWMYIKGIMLSERYQAKEKDDSIDMNFEK